MNSMPTRPGGGALLFAALALASAAAGGRLAWGAPQAPHGGNTKPPPPNAANPAATSNQAAPRPAETPGARVASGGGEGPHGAMPMDRQIARLAAASPAPAGPPPGGIDPSFWKAIVPADNAPSEARVALGRKLYFDPKLSRDGTVACATCHDVSRGFADRRGTSEGIGDKLGQRNAPTVLNAALFQAQFWDGRATTLEEQAKLPIVNPIEMGMPDDKAVVAAIKGDAEYQRAFQAAYGRAPNFDDLARAIAAFERTLVFVDAPFDRFLAGDLKAVNDDAKSGWVLFNGKGRCNACHQISSSSPVGTDNRFHNIGVAARHKDFEQLAKKALGVLAKDASKESIDRLALQTDLAELGRFVVTRNRADIGAFKTSQVRNVGVTAPYMHDGSLATLWDVVDHYNKGGEPNPYLDGGIEPLALNDREVDQLVAFMFSLTDVRFDADNRAEFERQRQIAARQRPHRDEAAAQRRLLPFERRATGAKLAMHRPKKPLGVKSVETKYLEERDRAYRALANLDRRAFLKVSAAAAGAVAAQGLLPPHSFQPVTVAHAQQAKGKVESFRFAYISDSHLYDRTINDRFVNSLLRAVDDVNAMDPAPDFVFYGGDLAQLGQPRELELGAQILKNVKAPLRMMVGEHDWYLDMGEKWRDLFGKPNYSFDHKGAHCVVLNSVVEKDFWTARKLSPMDRMKTVAGLDNGVQSPFSVGAEQRAWLEADLKGKPANTPLIVFSHSPLYKLYKQWNFWTDDADEVQAILRRFNSVVVFHGHTHQLLTNRIGNIHFHGFLSTAWPWPYAPQGMPELTVQMGRPDPFNPHDGCGDGSVLIHPDGLADKIYNLWNRNPVTVSRTYTATRGAKEKPQVPTLRSY